MLGRQVIVKFLDVMRRNNIVKESFKKWKNEVFEIRQRQADIEDSVRQKNELVEQHEKIF